MAWMARRPEQRADLGLRWPEARTVVCLALSYGTPEAGRGEGAGAGRGWISRYAWGRDYHKTMKKRLLAACRILEQAGAGLARPYVDTGPVLEKAFHQAAGVGWVGKNACLIHPELSSWLFLGEVIADLEIPRDTPGEDRCGTCTACLEACPTGALIGPGQLDARLCISYLTIENRGAVEESLREKMSDHLFGCDICQEVCPWNGGAPSGGTEDFRPRPQARSPRLGELAGMDREAFDRRFQGSAVRRARFEGFLRSVAVAMGNEGDPAHRERLEALARHPSSLVREHAHWALGRLRGDSRP
jgi:epoxyqueuosine reductase